MGKNRKAIFNFFRAHSGLKRALIERLNLWPARPRDAGRLASSCSANLAVKFCVPSHAAALPAHVSDQSKVGVKKIFHPPTGACCGRPYRLDQLASTKKKRTHCAKVLFRLCEHKVASIWRGGVSDSSGRPRRKVVCQQHQFLLLLAKPCSLKPPEN
jgi:hypothetical protein